MSRSRRPSPADRPARARPVRREPALLTPVALRGVLEELKRREPIFHRPEFAATREALLQMTAEDFWEVGASGRRYSRGYVLQMVAARQEAVGLKDEWRCSGFHCRELAPEVYLLTYTLLQGQRKTRRATVWQRDGAVWKIVFHQGTLVQESEPQADATGG
jgi:hypothetical protein